MGDKDDYLTSYRVFFEKFAATVDPKDQLPVNIAGYTITPGELPGEVLYWTAEYLSEIQCPPTLMTTLRRIVLEEVLIAAKEHPDEFGYDPNECEYEALRLMQAVTSKVNDVCSRYLDNSRLDTLPPPPPVPQRGYQSASAAVKNMRRVMEDRHVEISNLDALFGIETEEPTGFYAVYDGHAGAAAATYCAAHLHQYLVENTHYKKDLRKALHEAFIRTDRDFVRKSHQKRACGGSTAVVVCVRGRQLVAAWAGDSLALLAKRMGLLQLVNPHKPDRPDERNRIESSGGVVMFLGTWRVNGQLAVSRAIGNAQYKPYVTAQPEIEVIELDGDEDFVVVACDGLWDVVSEDAVTYSVYEQLMRNPDDVKAVTNKLVRQAKEHKSQDNITVIVVFLKDPRNIVADNRPPMDLGLENAVVNPPPFAVENEACKVVHGGGLEADNGVSDSDSDDLGPETAVDQDLDPEENHEPAPTPPAHTVDSSHVDGNLVDNVAESGEESEDEWNYYKGEGEREHNPSEEAEEAPRSETPCQDNSACESSSLDMNSSPLNPDAPVFVPGGVAGSDVLLAESPRKPLPMDDIELIDEAQFQTEAVIRPAELQDLDTSELNGHHNISMEGVTEHENGIDKSEMESLGFGFNMGVEEKLKEKSFTQDFERIQKDTTDFCNIQVFQSQTETNPFSDHGDDELFERLKNKERDPMSMSFYQEKDDDTCERFGRIESNVDLNAVQPLPQSDDEDIQQNGICIIKNEEDKENFCPEEKSDLFGINENHYEPNNDILKFDDRSDNLTNNVSNLTNFVDFTVHNSNNMQSYNTEFDCNNQEDTVAQTDTPESHKLLFEQIPEIPDGKSSELGFNNEDLLDPSEGESNIRAITPQDEEISQDIEMEIKLDELNSEQADERPTEVPEIRLDTEDDSDALENPKSQSVTHSPSPVPSESPLPQESSTFPAESPLPQEPLIRQETLPRESPVPQESSLLRESPLPQESSLLRESPLPQESSPLQESPLSQESSLLRESPLPQESCVLRDSPLSHESPVMRESSLPRESPLAQESLLPCESPLPQESPLLEENLPSESSLPQECILPQESLPCEFPILDEPAVCSQSPNPAESSVPIDIAELVSSPSVRSPVSSELNMSPLPAVSLQTTEIVEPVKSLFEYEDQDIHQGPVFSTEPLPSQFSIEAQSPAEVPLPRESPLPCDSPIPTEREVPIEDTILVSDVTQNKESPSEPIDPSEQIVESRVASDVLGLKEISTISNDIEKLTPLPNEESEVILSQSPLPVEKIDHTVETLSKSDETNLEELSQEQVPSPEPIIDLHPSKCSPSSEEPPLNESPVPNNIETTETDILLESQSFSHVESLTECRTVESMESKMLVAEYSETINSAPVAAEPVAESDHSRLTPEMAQEAFALEATEAPSVAAPAPDLLPHLAACSELVTDIDIGIPESRAQEICVPVTSEIRPEDAIRPGTTPPPTPAVEPTPSSPAEATVAAATAAVAVAAAATAAASKVASKKSPTTPTPKTDSRTPKAGSKTTTAARTPGSVTKKLAPSPSVAAPRSPAPRTPASAAKASPAPRPSPRPAPGTKPASKPAAAPAARSSAPAAAAASARPSAPPAARPAAPVAARSAPLSRSAPAPRAAPKASATKPAAPAAPRPAPAKPASATRVAAAPRPTPTSAPAAKPKESKPKTAAPKPLTNGDVKPTSRPASRPAAPPARAAPRAAPRPAAPTAPAPAPARPAARAALDKQSKDLANKRITNKAAPPRTASTKASNGIKSVPRPGKKSVDNKEPPSGAPPKAPPSPPADALLPDVIA